MSRRLIYNEEGEIIRELLDDIHECRWKVNGICFDNSNYIRYGKKCMKCENKKEETWRERKR